MVRERTRPNPQGISCGRSPSTMAGGTLHEHGTEREEVSAHEEDPDHCPG